MKNFKILLPLALLFFTTGVSRAQIVDTLSVSLEETVESAVTGNPDILISRLEIERAISQSKAANGAFLPNVGVDAQYVRNIKRPVFFLPPGEGFGGMPGSDQGTVIEAGFDNSYNMSAQASLPLYNRALIASSRTARKNVEFQERGFDIGENEIRAQVKKAYYDALLARESLQVLDLSLDNAQSNFENIRNQYSQQLVPEYDVIRAEVQVETFGLKFFKARTITKLHFTTLSFSPEFRRKYHYPWKNLYRNFMRKPIF